MSDAVIEIENFSFSFGKKRILRDVSLAVRGGEFLSIIGPNGAGKTTLIKCIDRILTGGAGVIKIDGVPIERFTQKDLAKLIGYVPQADGRDLPFTVHEFVMMGRYPHLSPFSTIKASDENVVHQALTVTGTVEFNDRLLGTLSGGERQKVFIAAALAQEAKILLLDEPTTFLDYKHQGEVQALLKHLNKGAGVTIVSVTHDINAAALTSDRIVALKHGSVVFSGPAGKLMNNEVLEAIYDKPFLFTRHPQTDMPIVVPQEVQA